MIKSLFRLSLLVFCSSLFAQNYVPKTLYVKVKPSVKSLFQEKTLKNIPLSISEAHSFLNPKTENILKNKGKMGKIELASTLFKVKYQDDIDPVTAAQRLSSHGDIVDASPVPISRLLYVPNDSLAQPDLDQGLGHNQLVTHNFYAAWDVERGDTNVVIASVDNGIRMDHEDLVNNIKYNQNDPINGINDDGDEYFGTPLIDNYNGWDMADDDNNPSYAPGSTHGHQVTGLSSASADNGLGVAGAGFHCKFLPIKASSNASPDAITHGYDGLFYAATHDCAVVNLSWGNNFNPGQVFLDLINLCVEDLDVVIVAAAGNSSSEEYWFPASFSNVLSVAPITRDTSMWSASTFNYEVDIAAAGSRVVTVSAGTPQSYSVPFSNPSGSSMASPVVAGAAGLLRSKYPDWSAKQIMQQLKVSGFPHDTLTKNAAYLDKVGKMLDPLRALTDTLIPGFNIETIMLPNNPNLTYTGDGDTIQVFFKAPNYLAESTSETALEVTSLGAGYSLENNSFNTGIIARMDTLETPSFSVIIPPTAESSMSVILKGLFTDSSRDYYHKQVVGFNLTKAVITQVPDSLIMENSEIALFPNPVSENLSVKAEKSLENTSYKILDPQGKEVLFGTINEDIKEFTIPMQNYSLDPGQFILLLEGEHFSISKPFIKL